MTEIGVSGAAGARHFAKMIPQYGQALAPSAVSVEQCGQVMTFSNRGANVSFVGNALGIMVPFMMPRDVRIAMAEGRGHVFTIGSFRCMATRCARVYTARFVGNTRVLLCVCFVLFGLEAS